MIVIILLEKNSSNYFYITIIVSVSLENVTNGLNTIILSIGSLFHNLYNNIILINLYN
jgi:hypothetical protein